MCVCVCVERSTVQLVAGVKSRLKSAYEARNRPQLSMAAIRLIQSQVRVKRLLTK